jgi:hypothetical protein
MEWNKSEREIVEKDDWKMVKVRGRVTKDDGEWYKRERESRAGRWKRYKSEREMFAITVEGGPRK